MDGSQWVLRGTNSIRVVMGPQVDMVAQPRPAPPPVRSEGSMAATPFPTALCNEESTAWHGSEDRPLAHDRASRQPSVVNLGFEPSTLGPSEAVAERHSSIG